MKTENITREVLNIIFAKKQIIIATTIVIFCFSIYVAFFGRQIFSASASILVREKGVAKNPAALEEIKQQIERFKLSKEDLSSEIETLTSFEVIERTTKQLESQNYFSNSDESGQKSEGKIKEAVSSAKNDQTISQSHKRVYDIKSNLSTSVIPASNVIEIKLKGSDPQKTVLVLNTLLDQYLLYHADIHNPAKQEFFSDHAEKFRQGMEEKNKELLELVEQKRVSEPKKEMENNLNLKFELEKELYSLQNEIIDKNILIENVEKALEKEGVQFYLFLEKFPLGTLSKKLQDLFIERGNLLRKYSEKNVNITLIDRQIDTVFAKLKEEVSLFMQTIENQVDTIEVKISLIEKRLNSIAEENIQLQKLIVDLNRVNKEMKMFEISYETFSRRREETRIISSSDSSLLAVSVISRAFPSNGPIFPNKIIVLPFGLFVGLVTGLSLAFIAEYFDHTFNKPEDVERVTDLPVLFTIEKWS
ncbi:MAG: hypothetical protein GY705_01185 [Bacteroidetes bacterium]|nr:hypothetical protein [Bacteroidota bacterium]